MNDEIMAALQQSEPLLVKLHNYKANGQKYQNLLALHPVFGPAPDVEYKYQIGLQLDFNNSDPDLMRKVAEMGRILRFLPQTVGGEKLPGVDKAVAELESLVATGRAQGGGMMGGGLMTKPGMGMGSQGMGMGSQGLGMGAAGGMKGPSGMGGMNGTTGMGGMNGAPGMGGMNGAPGMGGMNGATGMGLGGAGNGMMGMGMGGMSKPIGMGGGPAPPMGAAPSFESPRKLVASNGFNGLGGGGMGGAW